MRARRLRHLSIFALALGLVLSGCSFNVSYSGRWYSGRPDPVRVNEPPPATPSEQAAACKGQKVWVFGYWDWQNEKWTGVTGACRKPPEPGAEWVGPVLHEVDGGFELVPGHWAPPRSSGGEADDDRDRGAGVSAGGSARSGGKKPSKPSGNDRKKPSKSDGKTPSKPSGNDGQKPSGNDGKKPSKDDGAGAVSGGGATGGGSAAGGGDAAADRREEGGASQAQAGDRATGDKKPGRKPGRKPGAGAGGGATAGARPVADRGPDRSAQEGMAEAKEFECEVGKQAVQPGKPMAIKIEGLTLEERPKVLFGKRPVRVIKMTKKAVHVRVPRAFRERIEVFVLYGGTRRECGKAVPTSERRRTVRDGDAEEAGDSRRVRAADQGKRSEKTDGSGDARRRRAAEEGEGPAEAEDRSTERKPKK